MVPTTKEAFMNVMIGIDPHKASHTAVAIGRDEDQIASVKVRATLRQVDQLLTWAEPFEKRTWAIESVGGLGYLLGPAAGGPWRGGARCARHAGVAHPGTGHEALQQERPQRCHSIAIAALRDSDAAPGRAGRSRRGPPASLQAQQGSWEAAVPSHLPDALPLRRARTGRNCQGNVRL